MPPYTPNTPMGPMTLRDLLILQMIMQQQQQQQPSRSGGVNPIRLLESLGGGGTGGAAASQVGAGASGAGAGAVTIGSGGVATIPAGASGFVYLANNGTVAGTWRRHSFLPASYDFNATTANFGNATITNAVWNGTTIGTAYGGTGLTSFSAANYALYSTSSSALTAGTLPVAAGGTGAVTFTANGVLYGDGTNPLGVTAAGTTGQVLVGNTGGAPSWATVSSSLVSSFQTSLSGLTPSTATTGAVTLAGTLGPTSGGTGLTSYTTGDIIYASATNTLNTLAAGTNGHVLTLSSGIPAWAAANSMVYPGAGIPNSTGTAWGTSYNVTGTGDVVLSEAPTLTGAVTIGSTTGTDTITLGRSTGAQTVNVATGTTAASTTKAVNIGTAGNASSTTNIAIGSATGTSTTTINETKTTTTSCTRRIRSCKSTI
jgi:hypothetical protein